MAYPELRRRLVANSRLRPTKFTPERIQQIKELIARGVSCEEIASVLGLLWAR
jgi:DNA-binding NarL/FixJ family response regulator